MRFPRNYATLALLVAISWRNTSTWPGFLCAFLGLFLALLFVLWLCAPALWFRRVHGRWPWARPAAPCGAKAHAEAVRGAQDQVLMWRAAPAASRKPLCTAKERRRSVTTRAVAYKDHCNRIDLSRLDRIVALDADALTITCEPNIDMRTAQHFLASRGLALPITGETDKMSIGGTINGVGIESASHRFGLFYEQVLSLELLLADGSVVVASRQQNAELFHAVPFSYGTGGFLLSATLRVVPAKRYVAVSYRLARGHAEACALLKARATAPLAAGKSPAMDGSGDGYADDFVDGLAFSDDLAVVLSGRWTDGAGADRRLPLVRPVGHWWSPFYYQHVQKVVERAAAAEAKAEAAGGGSGGEVGVVVHEELMPAEDYFFRYDRGCFWTLAQAMPRMGSWWVRLLFGWALTSRLFHVLPDKASSEVHELQADKVVQDATVDLDAGADAIAECVSQFGIYPIWLCPALNVSLNARGPSAAARASSLVKLKPQPLMLDIGVYGKPAAAGYDALTAHRAMEAMMLRQGGFLFSYAISFVTRSEFWAFYDRAAYERFRQATHAEGAFPDIYEKIGGGEKVAHLEGAPVPAAAEPRRRRRASRSRAS